MLANPAFLKLDLLCRGVRLDADAEARLGRPIERTRAGLGSGVELILPGGLWVDVPVRERFARRSPYHLERDGSGRWALWRGVRRVASVRLPERPSWYEHTAASGRPLGSVGTMQGTYLAIYQGGRCAHWDAGRGPRNCRFCSIGLNIRAGEGVTKSADEIVEAARAARDHSGITYVDLSTGHLDGETYLDLLVPAIRRIKRELGLLVGVQAPPHSDLGRYDELRSIGVNRVSFCFELFDEVRFRAICPGKHATYGLERYLEAVRYCAAIGPVGPGGEPWVTNGELIAGLEPPATSIRAIDWLVSVGAIPTVCVFRPLVGTDLENRPPPAARDLVPVFRRLYEACMDWRLPIGCAPNIRVPLVLLPDECRWLSPRRYRRRRAELAVMAWLAAHDRGRRIARASRRAS